MICLAPSTEQNPYNKQTMLCLGHTDISLLYYLYYIILLFHYQIYKHCLQDFGEDTPAKDVLMEYLKQSTVH